jgi:hypothetical protein
LSTVDPKRLSASDGNGGLSVSRRPFRSVHR